ncbi:hypothetical protein [Dolichospermum sp. UHCC 0259]|uniref:hypothetical protein n=1 Tax=Dolichospermum sp. UHCC 0259 TaxID=2590010 RepID=UPI0014463682|nr:hypothetical protein [Dolichospermum sp. UHCC 0259]MTJ48200.1 hypothetical protein [Dolichospermum sp. UHCC 0259]
MKNKIALASLALTAFAIYSIAHTQLAQAIFVDQQSSTRVFVAQQSTPVCGIGSPSGKVATSYQYTSRCVPSWSWSISFTPNSSIVETPRSGMVICGSQAPLGYITTRRTYNSRCDIFFNLNRSNNAVVITKK